MIYDKIKFCQSEGLLPECAVTLVEDSDIKLIPHDEYKGEPLSEKEALCCAEAKYIAYAESSGALFTFAEDGKIGTFNRKNSTFIDSVFTESDAGVVSFKTNKLHGLGGMQAIYKKTIGDVTPLTQSKEDEIMTENPMDLLKSKLGAQTAPMNLQRETPKTETRSKKKEELAQEASQFQGKVSQMVAGVRNTISDDVSSYNQKFGTLLGYIPGNDAKVVFSISKYKPKVTAATASVGTGNEYKVSVRQSKPSKPKAVVLSVPENTFKSLDELYENRADYTLSNLLKAEEPTLITQIEATDVAHRIILLYFKGVIMENADVWAAGGHPGEQGKVECGYKQKVSKRGNGTPELHSFMRAYRESGITSQLVGWNYLPLKSYKEIKVGNGVTLSADEMQKLVDTVYQPLQSNGGSGESKDDASTKFSRLHASSKSNFHSNPDGTVSVDYFKRDTAAYGSLMSIKAFWAPRNSDEILSAGTGQVGVAYKEYVKPVDETKAPRFQYAVTSILDEDGEMIFDKFSNFVSVVGRDVLNQDTLKTFARRTASRRAEVGVIRGQAAQKLALGELSGSLQPTAGLKIERLEDLGASLEASQEAARAALLGKLK